MALSIDPSREQEFKLLQSEGKKLAAEGKLAESLQKFELAKAICPAPKVLQRIGMIKECLRNNSINQTLPLTSNSDEMSSIGNSRVSSKKNSLGKKGFRGSKVLNDIQNVQNSIGPHVASKSADLSPISQSKFRQLKKVAKESAYAGKYEEAINNFRKALLICDCPNVKKYILEVQKVMQSDDQVATKSEDNTTKADKQETDSHSVQNNTNKVMQRDKEVISKSEDNPKKADSQETDSHSVQKDKNSFEGLEPEESDRKKKLAEVKVLYDEARELAADGRLTSALKILQKAQTVQETEKVQKKIDKLKELIESDFNETDSDTMIKITDDFSIFHDIYKKLYPYQREGVAWMWKLYKMRRGGVLGDDMGLGKTFQVIAFISGMIDADLAKHVLVIMPVSLIQNWTKEFKKWCPGISVNDFHSGTKRERERNLLRVQKRGHVLLTSYGMILNNVESISGLEGREFVWDYVILDEGHKIKNPTKTTKAVYDIPSKNRLVLTGTPIQNNLRELWSLFDFVHQGTLLGSQKTFKLHYENPITRAREKDATAGEKQLGTEMAENLKSLIKPYFLRRTKDEIWGKKNDNAVEKLSDEMDKMMITKLNANKNDLIVWTFMSKQQIEIYQNFLHSDAVKSILVSKRSPLVELTILKKICDHPRLLSQRACLQLGLDGEKLDEDVLRNLDDESTMASSIDNVSDETLIAESGKLKLVINLLENLKNTGHRTLIFSLSRKILDMIHRILVNRQWKVMRLDGTISKMEERERRIQKFQNDSSYPVFLLTTQVGGVGITLTAADRVIIYDPSWNPATDAQAVDRVYRIGQQRDVIVYRLITCGTVEEKIYRRQVFKDSITRQATGAADPHRYFSKQELRELFVLDNPLFSATQTQLAEMHSSQRQTNEELENHIKYLEKLDIFGISDHDLMFSRSIQDDSEDNDQGAISDNFIKKQVATAHELIKIEASAVAEGIRLAGTFNRPYQESVPVIKKNSFKDNYKPPVLPDIIDLTEDAQDRCNSTYFKADSDLRSISKYSKGDDMEIDPFSPETRCKNNKEQRESYPIQAKIDKFFPIDEKVYSVSQRDKKSPSNSLVSLLKAELPTESKSAPLNASCYVEKLRKSFGCFEASPMNEDIDPALDDEKVVPGLTDYHDKDQGDVHSLSLSEQVSSEEFDPPKVPIELQEKFKNNLTQLMYEDLKDISFDPEESIRCVKGSRKSCARKSTFMMSESDTDHEIPDDSTSSVNLANDSEEADDDSSNSASLSFVPNSATNTPEAMKPFNRVTQSVSETPPTGFCFEPGSVAPNIPFESISPVLKRLEGSVRRITPLKIDKKLTDVDSSFSHAMANSLCLTPHTSPNNENGYIPPSSKNLVHNSSAENMQMDSSDGDDSPIKVTRKKKAQISSDSEESDEETHYNTSAKAEEVNENDYRTLSSTKVLKKKAEISSDSEESDVETQYNTSAKEVNENDHDQTLSSKKKAQISSDSEESDEETHYNTSVKAEEVNENDYQTLSSTKVLKKKAQISSDSEESDEETQYNTSAKAKEVNENDHDQTLNSTKVQNESMKVIEDNCESTNNSDEEPDYNIRAEAEVVYNKDQTLNSIQSQNVSMLSEVIEDNLESNKQPSDNENTGSENSDAPEEENLSDSEYSDESEYEEQHHHSENSWTAEGNSSVLILTSDSDESGSVFSQNGHETDSD